MSPTRASGSSRGSESCPEPIDLGFGFRVWGFDASGIL